MSQKQKLELTWVGKENRPRLEPRILLEDRERSYHAKTRVGDDDVFDNRLIFGDNLLALKALEQEFAGKVKCIFIDPPYNTGSAFEHYDDGLEHSIWLGLSRVDEVAANSFRRICLGIVTPDLRQRRCKRVGIEANEPATTRFDVAAKAILAVPYGPNRLSHIPGLQAKLHGVSLP